MLQLIQLRWIAVVGQVITITLTPILFGIRLPLADMFTIIAVLVGLNLLSLLRLKTGASVTNAELFLALVLDVAALTLQLYLSGGATNPFISLFLLQVTLSAVLLEAWSTWVMVAVTAAAFAGLTVFHRRLDLPSGGASLLHLHIQGMLICFLLDAALLVIFVGRINSNLRARDARLADLRQQAAEADHIVRMGLLASGAAHELGTPLATLSVILSDWAHTPALAANPELAYEIGEMEAEVQRCKAILTGILLSAGEARGEAPVATTVTTFLDGLVEDWRAARPTVEVAYDNGFGEDLQIVSDSALKQILFNVLDNAADASPGWIGFAVARRGEELVLTVKDAGPGFEAENLTNFGKPYNTSKGRQGGGLGLFLVVNVVRKLGGGVTARNDPHGGAAVTLTLPLTALALHGEAIHAG